MQCLEVLPLLGLALGRCELRYRRTYQLPDVEEPFCGLSVVMLNCSSSRPEG